MLSTQQIQGLRVKSYFASSFEEAMKQAQRDMGEDALLLNSREALPEARHLGAWEVVFGTSTTDAKPAPKLESRPVPKYVPPAIEAQPIARVVAPVPEAKLLPKADSTADGEDIRGHLQEIQTLLKRLAGGSAPALPASAGPAIGQSLIEAGLEPALAMEIEESVRKRIGSLPVRHGGRPQGNLVPDAELTMVETASELAERLDVQPDIGRVTALVGPPGCGKTTTLIKLAITQGLKAGLFVRLISTDTHRIGGIEQLQKYADILDVPFQAVETVAELARAIDLAPANSLTLIDTPGFSAAALEGPARDLALFLSQRQDIDTHLVLTASMRSADLQRTVDRFEVFSPSKLLFTKLDETDSCAAIFREAASRKRPLSFFSDGISIPENLQPASKERVIETLVSNLPQSLSRVVSRVA